MKLAVIYSRASCGINSPLVTVEAHLSPGFAKLHIVGLPETAVKESKERVRSAIMNSHFEFPNRRITINLAPADLPKEGGRFDLPIALGILIASHQLPKENIDQYEFTGELALSGELRPIRGVLPVVLGARLSHRTLIIPHLNAYEASVVEDAQVLSAKHLLEVCAYLKGESELNNLFSNIQKTDHETLDLSDVKGQPHAKRALEIAATGRHSLLFLGPPGTGKTMLASRLPSILPELNETQALEVAAIASISNNGFAIDDWKKTPFRSPHHSCSNIALVGGGRPPKPGEISLAHNGILFLDELPEFKRHVLECLREPLESGRITISRASYQTTFPADFQFIAAMNPCPCGYGGNEKEYCHCSPEQIQRYLSKISGPLLDRIDMQVEVNRIAPEEMAKVNEERSGEIRKRIMAARSMQIERQGKYNSALSVSEIERECVLDKPAKDLLHKVINKFNLSARVYHRMLKIARTIADLNNDPKIEQKYLSEAAYLRYLDHKKL